LSTAEIQGFEQLNSKYLCTINTYYLSTINGLPMSVLYISLGWSKGTQYRAPQSPHRNYLTFPSGNT